MKIELDENYYLCSDQYQYWIEKRNVSETGKESYTRCTGYHTNFNRLLIDFTKRTVGDCDAKSIDQLKKVQDIVENELIAFAKSIISNILEAKNGKKKSRVLC